MDGFFGTAYYGQRGNNCDGLMKSVFHFLAGCLLLLASTAVGADTQLVLTNARVYTLNPAQPWADTVAISGGIIQYVGDRAGADSHIGQQTRLMDLDGQMVLPGFQDIHIHPVHSGVSYQQCALFDIVGVDNLLAKVAACAADNPEWAWVRGGGWTVDNFAPSGLPDKKLLDKLLPDRPVSLKSSDGHSLWVNSKALELAGINASTPDPDGGRIDRYPGSREPSGSLQEESGMALIHLVEPELTHVEMVEGLRFAQQHLNALGITAVQDALVKLESRDAYRSFPAYHVLDEAGELSLHVVAAMYWENHLPVKQQVRRFKKARKQHSRGLVRATSIKIWQDGVLETHTAALLAPYLDKPDGYRGELLNNQERVDEAAARLDKAGFQLHFHAIGDAAIRSSLDAIQHARKKNGARDSRHHISHIQLFDPADIPRFAALDVVANFQPYWAVNDSYIIDLTLPKIGPQRGKYLYPIGSVSRSGAKIAFGSDWYVSSADPLLGIETAITRIDVSGESDQPLGSNEEISLEQAIAAYTINAAYVNFLEQSTGSIEVGKSADLAVLDNNLFAIPVTRISDTRVTATLFQGRLVAGKL